MKHDQSYLNSFSHGRISSDEIENGIRKGRRLRAQAVSNLFDKVRSHFVPPF